MLIIIMIIIGVPRCLINEFNVLGNFSIFMGFE